MMGLKLTFPLVSKTSTHCYGVVVRQRAKVAAFMLSATNQPVTVNPILDRGVTTLILARVMVES